MMTSDSEILALYERLKKERALHELMSITFNSAADDDDDAAGLVEQLEAARSEFLAPGMEPQGMARALDAAIAVLDARLQNEEPTKRVLLLYPLYRLKALVLELGSGGQPKKFRPTNRRTGGTRLRFHDEAFRALAVTASDLFTAAGETRSGADKLVAQKLNNLGFRVQRQEKGSDRQLTATTIANWRKKATFTEAQIPAFTLRMIVTEKTGRPDGTRQPQTKPLTYKGFAVGILEDVMPTLFADLRSAK